MRSMIAWLLTMILFLGCVPLTEGGYDIDDGSSTNEDDYILTSYLVKVGTNYDHEQEVQIKLSLNQREIGPSPQTLELASGTFIFSASHPELTCGSVQVSIVDTKTDVQIGCTGWEIHVPLGDYFDCDRPCIDPNRICDEHAITIWTKHGQIFLPQGQMLFQRGFAYNPRQDPELINPIAYVNPGAVQIAYWPEINSRDPEPKTGYYCRITSSEDPLQ